MYSQSINYIMKKISGVLAVLPILILSACPNGGEDPKPETCSDGIQNQDETGIDCGGSKCVECFDCFSDYCVFLAGSTPPGEEKSKKWKCTELDGVPIEDIDNCDENLGCSIYKAARLEIKSKGKATYTGIEGPESGRWNFDDPDNPKQLIIKYDNPDGLYGIQDIIGLKSISENEFLTEWLGMNGKFETY
jgi:hypothetical protein